MPVALTLALRLLHPGPCLGDDTRLLDYLYMQANEGGSSGGHVALGFDDRTYAYQRAPDARLVLERDTSAHLRWLYAVLGNRPIERSRIAVGAQTYERLRAGFNRRWLIQERQLAIEQQLTRGARLLALLAARARDSASDATPTSSSDDGLPIEAAGYFATAPDGAPSAALAGLRAAVAAAHGPDFLARRTAALRAYVAALVPDDVATPAPPTPDTYPTVAESFADRYTAAVSGLVALATLERAPELDPAALMTLDEPPLTTDERSALVRYAAALRAALVRLAASARPDFGFPLLVGMARLAAVERSLATDRLVVLDGFPADARRIPRDVVRRTADAARGLRDDACADARASLGRFTATAAPAERAYAALEDAANRCAELTRGLAEERDVRLAGDLLVPTRTAPVRDLAVPRASLARLDAAARAAENARRTYARALDNAYGYDLVRRNCVTETFATIDAVLGPEVGPALGARITSPASRIVPHLAARAVERGWRVAARDVTPSYRRARVEALARAGNPIAVRLRESNVLTSTVYRPSRDDSTFLFFTDDVVALRPLLGAANLVVGVGATALGLAQAPLDRGAGLRAGLRGVLWSLPELFFVNVRKGSFDHVARRTPPDAPRSLGIPPPSPR
ncbi:MAG: hypothetical protein IT293_11590 [Deltaproteobacteria bacterium]|nr:hypothetical protein [Deltaproteobacteria bacterium]